MNRGRVGEERGSKETDRCPLTDWEKIKCIYIFSLYLLNVFPQPQMGHAGLYEPI
jgi:hypothetical protein